MRSSYLPKLPDLSISKANIVNAYYTLTNFLAKLQTTPQVLEDRKPNKKKRLRTEFEDNITPSLALPHTPTEVRETKVEPVVPAKPDSTHTVVRYFNAVMSVVRPEEPEPPKIIKPSKPVYTDNISIFDKVTALEKQIQERKKIDKNAPIDDLVLKKVDTTWKEIRGHAENRAILFFYLLIAVYYQGVTVNKADTLKQHGKGSMPDRGTNACHCSLFPNLKLDPIPSKWIPPVIAQFFPRVCPSLAGTHFGEVSNMTEELDRLVNEFDMFLEGKVHDPSNPVRALTNIINKVSLGWWDPKKGMDEFYKRMDLFFTEFEKEDYKTITADKPMALKKVCEYQKEGTFMGANKDRTAMSDDYLHLLLRLKPDEIKAVKRSPRLLTGFYQALQKEIFASAPVKKATVRPAQPAKEQKKTARARKHKSKGPATGLLGANRI